jgi:hypothetical protein
MFQRTLSRTRKARVLVIAPSMIALSFGLAAPARAQLYFDGATTAEDKTYAVCHNGDGSISLPIDNDCDTTGAGTGETFFDFQGLGFGATNGTYNTYLSADGSAYFGQHFQVDGDAFFEYTQIDGQLVANGPAKFNDLLTSNDGIVNHKGLTNSGGISNSGGITSSGLLANTGNLTNSGTLHNTGDATFDNKLSAYQIATGSLDAAGYIIAGAIITANGGLDVHNSLTVYSGTNVNLGGNRIQNVGTPTAGTDAANKAYVDALAGGSSAKADQAQATANTSIAHENTLGQDTSSALGGGAAYDPNTGHVTAPNYVVGTISYNSVGAALNAANTTGLAYFHSNSTLGDGSATGANATAIGAASTASGAGAFAAGNGAVASAAGTVAVGQGAHATGTNAVAIGLGATASGSVALGTGATAANGGSAIGDRTTATGVNSAALGADASATADNAVALGSSSVATVANTVSVGSSTNQRRVVYVAAGTAPTDAANVSQLAAGNGSIAAALGGGAVANAAGVVSAPTYTLDGTTYHDVGSALTGLASGVAGVAALAYDIRKEERRGIAAAVAMANAPMPSAPGRTSWATNAATFHGEVGFGGSLAHRFDTGSDASLAVTAGFAYAPGGNSVAKVGMAGEF